MVARDGLDGDHVGGNNLEGVPYKTDCEGVLEGSVNESKEVFLALGQRLAGVGTTGAIGVDVTAIEENIVAGRRGAGKVGNEGITGIVDAVGNLENRTIVPVRENEWSKIGVVIGGCGSLDDDGSKNTVSVLEREVRMVPGLLADIDMSLGSRHTMLCRTGWRGMCRSFCFQEEWGIR